MTKKKIATRKLSLNRQSVRVLSAADLGSVAGGISWIFCPSGGPFCPGPVTGW